MNKDKENSGISIDLIAYRQVYLIGIVAAVLTSLDIGKGAGLGMLLGVVIGTTIDHCTAH